MNELAEHRQKYKILGIILLFIMISVSVIFCAVSPVPYRNYVKIRLYFENSSKLAVQYFEKVTRKKQRMLKKDGFVPTNPNDVYQTVKELQNFIYEKNFSQIRRTYEKWPLDPEKKYEFLGKYGWITCGKISEVYAWALEAFDIPFRFVQLATKDFVDGKERFDTHVLVEIFDGERWFVSDPTFNAEYFCSDGKGPLSIKESKVCLSEGNSITPKYGKTVFPGRRVEDYYLPLEKLLYAYVLRPTIMGDQTISSEEHPCPNWLATSLAKYKK